MTTPNKPENDKNGGWLNFLRLIFIAPLQWLVRIFTGKPPALPPSEKSDQQKLPPGEAPEEEGSDAVADAEIVEAEIVEPTPVIEPEPAAEPEVEPEPEPVPEAPEPKLSFAQRIRAGLSRGNSWLTSDLRTLFAGGVDEDILEDFETQLLMADVGVEATDYLVDALREKLAKEKNLSADQAVEVLRGILADLMAPCDQPLVIPADHNGPFVVLVVGVNGVGKTTTIGKLAHYYREQGHSVMLAAGDTFRAAAVEQLQVWGERNDIPVVAQHTGADSASVIFDALESAKARNIDVLIADTAGRLHTQDNLMDELKKVKRVLGKLDETAPHETLLVIDGGTGQNALSQVELFNKAVTLSGLAITKLDGTAKGGVLFAVAHKFASGKADKALPIRFIGVGEAREDLGVFKADEFIGSLFPKES